MAKKKQVVDEEQAVAPIEDVALAEEVPQADAVPQEDAVETLDLPPEADVPPEAVVDAPAEYEVDVLEEALPEDIPEPAPAEEAMQEVEALPAEEPELELAPEEAALAEAQQEVAAEEVVPAEEIVPAEEVEFVEGAPAEEVAAPVEEVVAPAPPAQTIAVAASVAPIVATAAEAVAPAVEESNMENENTPSVAMPAPDYNPRRMRRERNGYAGHFRLAEGEQVLSMYRALKGKGVSGRIYLTNRRFLMESALRTEMPIETVAGVSSGKTSRVKVVKLIFSLLFMIGGAGLFVAFFLPNLLGNLPIFEDMAWLKYVIYGVGGLLAFIGFIMFCTSFSSRFVFTVLTTGVQQTITIRSSATRKDLDIYQPLTYGRKGRDYKAFCANFGARLAEIRKALGK